MGSIAPQPAAHTFAVSNPFRDRILAGQVCSVMSCKYVTGNEISMMCKMAGIDGMFIDIEYSSLNFNTVAQFSLACNFVGVSPIVRSPSKLHWHLSTILDAGAAAIVIPHVESVEEVREIVRIAKYAPLGVRGCAGNQPMLNFQNVPTLQHNDLLNRENMLIPMIETLRAADLVEEFLAVPGVDGILIGSNDLCTDLGILGQYDNPLYQDAVIKIVLAGKKAGIPIGIGGIGGRQDFLEKWFAMGSEWCGWDYNAMNARVQKVSGMEISH
ncbi:putative 4-hydroxy-2-oxovalerate aldolase [Rhexocercosporidium sp. MPI-PUGE-AT-0058]|nr:putative 4-hydroxy-2-oxovalerate aldolase [Rhexocercosporidium sp. MPI-PUGE-AT-0058]